MKNPLNESELAELRSVIAERAAYSGPELARAYRAASEMDRSTIEQLTAAWWDLVEGKSQLDFASFTRLLGILGRSIQHFESDMRAVEMQRRAEAQQEADRKERELILKRAEPAQQALDAATAAIFGPSWKDDLESGLTVEAPFLVDLERGSVVTKIAALRDPCAELEKALAGVDQVFRYGFTHAPTFLVDAKEKFTQAVEAHFAAQAERRQSA